MKNIERFKMVTIVVILLFMTLYLLSTGKLMAQATCGNRCGKNLTFNGDFEKGNVGFYTGNTNIMNRNPKNFGSCGGNYMIDKSSVTYSRTDYAKTTWKTGYDHTSKQGNFMIADPPCYSDGVDLWEQSITIKEYTTYEFSCWVSNLSDTANLPVIHFLVNGQEIPNSAAPVPFDPVNKWTKICATYVSDFRTLCVFQINVSPSAANVQADVGLDDISLYETVLEGGNTESTINPVACETYTVPSGKNTYAETGTYFDTIPNAGGCDSAITIHLKVNHATSSLIKKTACETYSLNNQTYTASGTYTQTLQNSQGCDSILTLQLTIKNKTTSTINEKSCTSYTTPSGRKTYTVSGTYKDTILNAAGCDSIITILLTINNKTTSIINEKSCTSYTTPSGRKTYTVSGTYKDTILNAAGCDSIITIHLTILQSSSSAQTEVACDRYTWNGTVYTTSGTYTKTIPNQAGCDSIMTLNLKINESKTASITETACRSYKAPDGSLYEQSGDYIAHIKTRAGCDSTIHIALTVIKINIQLTQQGNVIAANESNANYQWMDCSNQQLISGETRQNYMPATNGEYAVIITKDGCKDTSDCISFTSLGIAPVEMNKYFSVYPNPALDIIHLSFDKELKNARIRLIDVNGKVLLEENQKQGKIFSYDLKSISSGIYIIEMMDENILMRTRLIKN